jgi:glucose/arabinose dehydrogenase
MPPSLGRSRPRPPLRATSIALAGFLLASCGSSATPSAQPSAQASASTRVTPAPTPSVQPTEAPTPTPLPLQGLALEEVASELSHPVDVRARPSDGALFVVEQSGVIRRVTPGGTDHPVMLDIRDEVNDYSIEQGLLGMAFHPDYPADPRVFVFHSLASNDNVLASYETRGDPDVLDPSTRRELLVVDKEPDAIRHNAGTILFGPDGMLYLSLGDAEHAGTNGQDPRTLPGSILRIDVDDGDPYAIPSDNPFASGSSSGVAGAPEVWWFGLRNPWRFTYDAESGLAYIGDVGQEGAEEVDVAPLAEGGLNFGWPSREGFNAFLSTPLASDATDPVIEMLHDDTDRGCSVTGGSVYRGAAIPELDGTYFYADWCYGWIRSFVYADGTATEPMDWSDQLDAGTISSFGVDSDGEILVLGWDAGTLSRIVPVRAAG